METGVKTTPSHKEHCAVCGVPLDETEEAFGVCKDCEDELYED